MLEDPRLSAEGAAASFRVVRNSKEGNGELLLATCKGAAAPEVADQAQFEALGSAKAAVVEADKALAELMREVEQAPGLQLEKSSGMLRFTSDSKATSKEAGQKTGKAGEKLAAFNEKYVSAKVALTKCNFAGGLKDAIWEIKDNLQAQLKDKFVPKIDVDPVQLMQDLMQGEMNVNLKFGDLSPEDLAQLPSKLQKCYDALLSEEEGDEGLIPFLKLAAKECAELQEKGQKLIEAAQALPTSPDELKAMAQDDSGNLTLGFMELLKLPGKLASNSKQLTRLPSIIKGNLETMKSLLLEVSEAMVTAKDQAKTMA